MRKLIVKMSMSADGFIAGPNGEIDWIFPSMSEEGKMWILAMSQNAGLLAMGSRVYPQWASYWPASKDMLAASMNLIPKVVFSRTGAGVEAAAARALEVAAARATPASSPDPQAVESWRSARIVTGDLAEEMTRLKQAPGKDILVSGGADFAQSLAAAGVVDEYRLVVHPVVIGRGISLFSRLGVPVHLELVEVKAFNAGTVAHIYRPKAAGAHPSSRGPAIAASS